MRVNNENARLAVFVAPLDNVLVTLLGILQEDAPSVAVDDWVTQYRLKAGPGFDIQAG